MHWLNKHKILDSAHAHDLERHSALLEFHHGMPREQAEKAAHDQYILNHLYKGAAFHLDGMSDAKSNGNTVAANNHYGMYLLYCQKLQKDPKDPVAPEILAQRGQFTDFKECPVDELVLSK